MLVLSRRLNEVVVLPNREITIRVLKVRRNGVVLGIEAPKEVRITRINSDNVATLNERNLLRKQQ